MLLIRFLPGSLIDVRTREEIKKILLAYYSHTAAQCLHFLVGKAKLMKDRIFLCQHTTAARFLIFLVETLTHIYEQLFDLWARPWEIGLAPTMQ